MPAVNAESWGRFPLSWSLSNVTVLSIANARWRNGLQRPFRKNLKLNPVTHATRCMRNPYDGR